MRTNEILDPKVLQKILRATEDLQIALIGSANLALQNISLPIADLDFLTNDAGVESCSKVFQGKIIEERDFKEFWTELDGITINFTSYENNPLRNPLTEENTISITLENITIPCLTLKEDAAFYKKAGREKDKNKLQLIKEALTK